MRFVPSQLGAFMLYDSETLPSIAADSWCCALLCIMPAWCDA